MLANDSSMAKAQLLDGEYPPNDEQSAQLGERMHEIARRHQVCYEVWPERSSKEGRTIRIGFELQLCGANTHTSSDGPDHEVPGCAHCVSTYGELRQIAEWILPREVRPSRYEIDAFDHSFHIAPKKRKSRNEVVLTIHIMHRSDFNREVDDCEDRCLKEMQQQLHQLGIVEGMWHEPPEQIGQEQLGKII